MEILTVSAKDGLVEQSVYYNGNTTITASDKKNYVILKKGDFSYNKSYSKAAPWGACKMLNLESGLISSAYFNFRFKEQSYNEYYQYYFESSTWHKNIFKIAQEGARNHGMLNMSKEDFFSIKMNSVTNDIRFKTANILSQIDNLINCKSSHIHQLQIQKQSFIQSQMKYKKCDGYTSFKLYQIISEKNETSVKGQLEHVSLTKRGVVPKTDRYNRDALVTDDTIKKYKVTRLHDLVYNPANLKFGVIALNTYKDGIFSPIYVTYSINSNVNKLYLSTYCSTKSFLQYIRKYEEGTVYERMAVKSSDFLKATVFLPSLEIQSRFSKTLSQMDNLTYLHCMTCKTTNITLFSQLYLLFLHILC